MELDVTSACQGLEQVSSGIRPWTLRPVRIYKHLGQRAQNIGSFSLARMFSGARLLQAGLDRAACLVFSTRISEQTQPSQPSQRCGGWQPRKGSSGALATSANSLRTRSSASKATPTLDPAPHKPRPAHSEREAARPRPPRGSSEPERGRLVLTRGPALRRVEGPSGNPCRAQGPQPPAGGSLERGGDTRAPQAPPGSEEAVSPFYSPTEAGWVRETPCGSF